MGQLLEIVDFLSWLCKPGAKVLFTALDSIEQIVLGLAGISSNVSAESGRSENVVVQLLQSQTTRRLMTSFMLFGIFVLFLCVILAIVRNVYKDDSKVTISSIIGQAIKAVIGFILVPALCLVGVMFSNVILQAIAGVTSAGGETGNSFSSGIYMASAVGERGNLFYDYTNTSSREDLNKMLDKHENADGTTEVEDTEISMEFSTIMYAQYLYYILCENYYWTESTYYNPDTHNTQQTLYINSRNDSGAKPPQKEYLDVLGLKVQTDKCKYLDSATLGFNFGDGSDGFIDTPEDVLAFYNVLYSQYLKNFPNAIGKVNVIRSYNQENLTYEELVELSNTSTSYPKLSIHLKQGKMYFGCHEKKDYSFVYKYFGEFVFANNDSWKNQKPEGANYTLGERGYKLLKGAYESLCKSGYFHANDSNDNMRFDFWKTDNSLTNTKVQVTLGIGSEINWFYAFLSSVLIFKSLFFLCFGLAKRIVQLIIYYVLSPIALALYPFDNGKAFGSWKSDFIGYTIGGYGAVAGMNISIQLTNLVTNLSLFSSSLLNAFVRLIMYIVLAQGIETMVKMLSGWIGAKDLLAEGKETSNKATAPIKKVAGAALKIGGAVVGGVVAAKTAAKIASNKRRQAADDKTTFNNMPADQQEEIARAHGFNSAADYMSSLDKTIADNGSGSAFFKSAGKSALAGAGQILGSTTGGALGKSAMDGYKAFRGDQSTPSDSWLARKLGGKGDAYRQLQEVQSKTTAAVLGSESQAIVSSAMDKFVEKTSEPINKSITAANVEMTAAQTNLRSAEQNLAKVEKQFNAALENAVGVMTSKNGLDVSKDDAKAMLERGDFSSVQNDPVKYALAVEEVARFSQTKIAQTYQEANEKVQEAHSSVQAIQSSIDNLNDKLAETSMSGGNVGTFISNVTASIDPDMLGNLMAAGDTATIERVVKNAISSQAKAGGISLGDDFKKQLVDTIMKTMAGPAKQLKETADKIKQTTTGKK